MLGDSLWEQHSAWWQQNYTQGADPEYEEQILPLAEDHLREARRILDVGCGEGQVSRRVARPGVDVVGVDPAPSQIRAAHDRSGGSACFVQARAEHLPYPSAAFDAVVVCLALEHMDPFEPAIHEIARVLAPGGRFLLFLSHPLLQTPGSGWVDEGVSGEEYWRVGPYLPDDVAVDEVAPGVHLQFAHRSLSRYVHVMGAVGLLIEDMVEPSPTAGLLMATAAFPNEQTIPRLMLLLARRLGTRQSLSIADRRVDPRPG
jgi:SAM-dependent methyltransferase